MGGGRLGRWLGQGMLKWARCGFQPWRRYKGSVWGGCGLSQGMLIWVWCAQPCLLELFPAEPLLHSRAAGNIHSLPFSCSTLQLERLPSSTDRSNCSHTRAVGTPIGQRESQHPKAAQATEGQRAFFQAATPQHQTATAVLRAGGWKERVWLACLFPCLSCAGERYESQAVNLTMPCRLCS
eukprot:347246-Chlamydomonas_euryale.AAC.5